LEKYLEGKGQEFMSVNFFGQAFISFETELEKEYILEKYR